ncbi:MAG: N-formylglutamate deformylase [Rhodospirillaceae bacterium]|nr:N-formylglutamate deformylase [Rhodospirillaceae bacterium]
MDIFRFSEGRTPLLVSMPHVGIHIPDALRPRLTPAALAVPDTDWHVDRLYDFLAELGAGVLRATHSRYVIDLNRDPSGQPLYPGARNTELCPTTLFDDSPVYRPRAAPDEAEVQWRLETWWRPYHARLQAELDRLKAHFGYAVLFDAHSIRSRVPRFFEGRLPDLNLGTAGGSSAAPELIASAVDAARASPAYCAVLDGRFKGGYITRHYGRPQEGVHAIQLELAQMTYMDEDPPYAFREDLAAGLRPVLRGVIEALLDWRPVV